jgi:hypothetical protein
MGSPCPLSLQRDEKLRERGKGVAIVAVLAEIVIYGRSLFYGTET